MIIQATERVMMLREKYLSRSIMVQGRKYGILASQNMDGDAAHKGPIGPSEGLHVCRNGQAVIQYVKGWMQATDAPTIRMRLSMAEAYMLRHLRPVIVDGELIVGQPDLRVDAEEYKEYNRIYCECLRYAHARESHIALDYPLLLQNGVEGLISRIREKREVLDPKCPEHLEKIEFYDCCVTELEALLDLADRYASALEEKAAECADRRDELMETARIVRKVPRKPADTFREALQSVHFYTFSLFGLYSYGRPDEYLYEYYRNDIASGRLSAVEAQELVDCFCLQFAANVRSDTAAGFQLGGRDHDGKPVENELTWYFLNSIPHTHIPDPNIGLCITSNTSEELLRYVSELLSTGESHPALWNDEVVYDQLCRVGVDKNDAHQYTHSTCVEVTVVGCSGQAVTSPYVNTLEPLNRAIAECPDGADFETLWQLFSQELQAEFDRDMMRENLWLLDNRRNAHNPARTSVLVNDCIASGKAVDENGGRYNHMLSDFVGMGNAIESLNVIRYLVYEKKLYTLSDIKKAIKDNFADEPALRRFIRSKVPHWGNNTPESDALAKRVADLVCSVCATGKTYRGASVLPGGFSYLDHVRIGKETGASADGRYSGSPLNDGSGPVQGFDRSGPTATLSSVNAYEPGRFLGGIAHNMKISRNTKNIPGTIFWLIQSFRDMRIPEMQITVTDAEELYAAQLDPDSHANLLVRVGGYSDYFVLLSKELQDEIIEREEHI